MKGNKHMKTITKLPYAAFAVVVLALGALTASDAPAAPTARPTPTPRPRPMGPPALAASIDGNGHNRGGFVYEYPRYGMQITFASGLSRPRGLAFDSEGNLFVATSPYDPNTCQTNVGEIVKITPGGVQSLFATVDPACDSFLEGLAVDGAGNIFVVANLGAFVSSVIYEFTPDGVQSTFASPPSIQSFGLAFDSAGNLYTVVNFETEPSQIWKYLPDGTPSVFATASSLSYGFADLAFDRFGNLFVSTESNGQEPDTIRKFTPDGMESMFATGLSYPRGLAFDNSGNLFVAEIFTNAGTGPGDILKFTPTGTMTVFASGIAGPQFLAFRR
jgi:sugar lactone lactonase YvrE